MENIVVLTIKEHVSEFIKRNDPRSRFSNIIIGHKTRWAWPGAINQSIVVVTVFFLLLLLNIQYSYIRRWVSRPKPNIAWSVSYRVTQIYWLGLDFSCVIQFENEWVHARMFYLFIFFNYISRQGRSPNVSCIVFSFDTICTPYIHLYPK